MILKAVGHDGIADPPINGRELPLPRVDGDDGHRKPALLDKDSKLGRVFVEERSAGCGEQMMACEVEGSAAQQCRLAAS